MAQSFSRDALEPVGLAFGVGWVTAMAVYLVGTGVLRGVNMVMPLPTGAAALAVAVIATGWCVRPSPRQALAALTAAVLLGALAVTLGAAVRDISYDGPSIHLASAMEISDGLNPVTTRPAAYFSAVYPNGLWTLQAFFMTLTEGLEAGKAPAWLLAFASVPLSALALRTLRGAWTPGVVLAAVVLQLNPVLLTQLTSFELDGAIHSLALIAVSGAILLTTGHARAGLLALCGALVLLANAKITGLYWAGCIGLGVVVQSAIEQRGWSLRRAGVLLAVLATAVVLVGWRPYVTVPLETGALFGASTAVVVGAANLADADPLTRMAYLLFGVTSNPVTPELARLKWPWSLSASEFVTLFDVRSGGFGPGFGLQVLGAALVGTAALWRMRRVLLQDGRWLGPFWVAALFLATLLFPAAWWARLVSPFWLVAVLPLAFRPADGAPRPPVLAWLGTALVVAGVLVSSASTAATLRLVTQVNMSITKTLADISARGDAVRIVPGNPLNVDGAPRVWHQRLLDASVFPVVGPADGCRQPLFASGSVQLCIDKDKP